MAGVPGGYPVAAPPSPAPLPQSVGSLSTTPWWIPKDLQVAAPRKLLPSVLSRFSRVRLLETLWTVARQAPYVS